MHCYYFFSCFTNWFNICVCFNRGTNIFIWFPCFPTVDEWKSKNAIVSFFFFVLIYTNGHFSNRASLHLSRWTLILSWFLSNTVCMSMHFINEGHCFIFLTFSYQGPFEEKLYLCIQDIFTFTWYFCQNLPCIFFFQL